MKRLVVQFLLTTTLGVQGGLAQGRATTRDPTHHNIQCRTWSAFDYVVNPQSSMAENRNCHLVTSSSAFSQD